jgi:hypothetical protein
MLYNITYKNSKLIGTMSYLKRLKAFVMKEALKDFIFEAALTVLLFFLFVSLVSLARYISNL